MKVLFTADWQASWNNLDRLDSCVAEILETCESKSISTVAILGDIKHTLNPVDQRVTNRILDIAHRFTEADIRLIALKGNHDQLSTHSEESWFPTLEAFGMTVADTPGIHEVNGVHFAVLPFERDREALLANAKKLAAKATKNTILLFHAEVNKCHLTVQRQSDDGISAKELFHDHYQFCVGGHIHMQQNVTDNVFYCGSPFAQDWGEANQRKGYLILDVDKGTLKAHYSCLPGWFDPTWPGFTAVKDYRGARVRIHVPIDGIADVPAVLHDAKIQAELKYAGAEVVLIAEMTKDSSGVDISKDSTDEEAIRAYIKHQTLGDLEKRDRALASYILYKLSQVSVVRRSSGKIRFKKAEAENVLSFESVKANYLLKGITVVTGVNKDWKGRSNGSGKTGFLQLPALALFGKTLKGQSHDGWKRNGSGPADKSYVRFEFDTADGSSCVITRGRNPRRLDLVVNGQDVSSGSGDRETQKAIEVLTGITWDVACNALYVDQERSNRLLDGTDSERKAIISQALNLERFSKAQELAKADLKKIQAVLASVEEYNVSTKANVLRLKGFLREFREAEAAKRPDRQAIEDLKVSLTTREARLNALQAAKREAKAVCDAQVPDSRLEPLKRQLETLRDKRASVGGMIQGFEAQVVKSQSLDGKVCPVCKQSIDRKHLTAHLNEIRQEIAKLTKERSEQKTVIDELAVQVENFVSAASEQRKRLAVILEEKSNAYQKARTEVDMLRDQLSDMEERYKEADRGSLEVLNKYLAELREERARLRSSKAYRRDLIVDQAFLVLCVGALSKDGIPALIIHRLCPKLNKVAKYYSDLFSDGEIEVNFTVSKETQDIEAQITNAHGGNNLEDQSRGELRIASLVTSFSLRDVALPCNVLIADEPGEGLDEVNARTFARRLKECAHLFDSVIVTSHNPFILSELSTERQIEIQKRDNISKVREV